MDVAKLAANNFTAYKVVMNKQYQRARHLDLLDRVLMEVARYLETGQGIQNLIVELPPRSGKTLSISEMFPGWLKGRRADTDIILASYGASLAEMASRRARDYVNSAEYKAVFPDTLPDDNLQKAGEWGVVGPNGEKSHMVAVGLGGALTGKGMNLMILDDPIKNRIEAENATIRQQAWDAYTNDLLSRFNTSFRAAQIITAQRYHPDDLIGRVLASSQAKKWHRLRLPAIAEENDPLGREIGEVLWPERYTLEALLEIEERDSYSFASQYQQRPIPRGETMFDATKIITVAEPPPLTGVVRFWDIAVTTKKRNDYTVGLKLGITANEEIIILDVWRGKVRAPDMLDLITRIAHQDGQHVAQVLEGEKAGIMQLDYLLNEPKLRGFTLVTQPIQGDKLTRASGIATRVQYERVAMVKGIWNDAFISEIAVYPASNHDDQVDALSGAYKYLSELGLKTFTVENLGTVDRW